MKLNGNELIEILPLADLYSTYQHHRRLHVFVNKGRKCVTCENEGVLLLITVEKNGKTKHVDLYTKDFVLMTVDHITPKAVAKELGWSKSRTENLRNKQPMCTLCNSSKGCKPVSNKQLKNTIKRIRHNVRTEVIAQLVYNPNIFNKNISLIRR